MISKFLIKNLYPNADLIIPNSRGIKANLIEDFNIEPKKIRVIHNPINLNKIYSLSEETVAF